MRSVRCGCETLGGLSLAGNGRGPPPGDAIGPAPAHPGKRTGASLARGGAAHRGSPGWRSLG